MLGLVLANGHQIRVINQNVGCHQNRVGEQTAVDVIRVLGALILELGHAGKFAKLGVAGQNPGKLAVGGNMALHKQHMLFRVNAHSQQQGGHLAGLAAQVGGGLAHGQSVQVSNHIQAVIIRLQQGPVAHRADIIAQRGGASGLDARKNALALFNLFCHGEYFLSIFQ